MKNFNSIFNHPVAKTIAKIAIMLFLIDFIKKIFSININVTAVHSAAYNLGYITGGIANIAVKVLGAIVILKMLFTRKNLA